MRNPVRLKNLRARFLPFYAAVALALIWMQPSRQSLAVGLCLIVLGGAVRTWAAGHLVKNDRLTVTGPYAHMRHPLYVGTLLIGIGFSIAIGGWMAAALLAVLMPWFFLSYFPRKDRIEGERLALLYGDSYRRYRAQVPALLPSFRPWRPAGDSRHRWSGACYDGNNELGTVLALAAGIVVLALRSMSVP